MTSPTVAAGYAATGWRALGSYAALVVADADRLTTARAASEQLLDRIDRSCSRFRADSDLIRANRTAGRWVRVDPLLVQAVTAALQVAETTDGLVDPTLGSQLVALGYDRDLDEVHARENLRTPVAGSGGGTGSSPSGIPVVTDGWRQIGVDPEGALLVPDGMALDLGATGKAFAADLIAATVPEQAGTALIISLGGDVAIGRPDDSSPGSQPHPWRISVAERPEDADRPDAETVILESGGLATSSTLARRWRHSGGEIHHLLDPRTGAPVRPVWRTASVCAATCLAANAASTAAIVLAERAPAWLRQHDLAARLVGADGTVLRLAGWPEPEPEPEPERATASGVAAEPGR